MVFPMAFSSLKAGTTIERLDGIEDLPCLSGKFISELCPFGSGAKVCVLKSIAPHQIDPFISQGDTGNR